MDLAFRKNLRQSPLQQLQEIAENIVILNEQQGDFTIIVFTRVRSQPAAGRSAGRDISIYLIPVKFSIYFVVTTITILIKSFLIYPNPIPNGSHNSSQAGIQQVCDS